MTFKQDRKVHISNYCAILFRLTNITESEKKIKGTMKIGKIAKTNTNHLFVCLFVY